MLHRLKSLKYSQALILPVLGWISFQSQGWVTFAPLLWAFGVIPALELFFKPDERNFTPSEEDREKYDPIYDWQIYLMVPVQFLSLWLFLESMQEPGLAISDRIGRIASMGILCGVIGVNVAHELGHRQKAYERFMAKALLMTSLYMHFFIEHNRGHHKYVSTEEDPASARYGESLYAFWLRAIPGVYRSAWRLERARLKRARKPFFSLHNEMLIYHLVQAGLFLGIALVYGWATVGCFAIAAGMGYLLLETVNYIEHYGLQRQKVNGKYERVMPWHSWNSDHVVGRLVLFELSRHSDHHFIASRKYQILRHIDHSPQMPTGYPGMMILATLPPIWFSVMNPKIQETNLGKQWETHESE